MSSTQPSRAELTLELEALRKEVGRLRQVQQNNDLPILLDALDVVPSLVSFVDVDGIYRYNNRRYEEWFGLERADLRGQRVVDVIGEIANATTQEYLKRALEGQPEAAEAQAAFAKIDDVGAYDAQYTLNASVGYKIAENLDLYLYGQRLIGGGSYKRYAHDSGNDKPSPRKVRFVEEPLAIGCKLNYIF